MKIFIYLYGLNLNNKIIKIKMNLKKLVSKYSIKKGDDNNNSINSDSRCFNSQSNVNINTSNIFGKINPNVNAPHNISLTNNLTANNNSFESIHVNNDQNSNLFCNNYSSNNIPNNIVHNNRFNNNISNNNKYNFGKIFNIDPNNNYDSDDSSKDVINYDEIKYIKEVYGTEIKHKYYHPQGQDFTFNNLNENYTKLLNVNDIYNSQNDNINNIYFKTNGKSQRSNLLNNKRKRSYSIDIQDDNINENTSCEYTGFKNMSDIKQFQEKMIKNQNLNLSEENIDTSIPKKKKKGWPKGKKRKNNINDNLNIRGKCILFRYKKIKNLFLREKEKILNIAKDMFKKDTLEYFAIADNKKDTYMFLQYLDKVQINGKDIILFKYKDITPEITIVNNIDYMFDICTDFSSYYSNYPLCLISSENSIPSNEIILENPKNNNDDNPSYYDKLMTNNNNISYNLLKKPLNCEIKRICIWLYGPSNVGKNYLINKIFLNKCYYKDLKNNIWHSYNREDVVVVDLPCDFDAKVNRNSISLLDKLSENKINQAYNKNRIPRIAIYPQYHVLIVIANESIENLFEIFPNYKSKFKIRFQLFKLSSKDQQKEISNSIIKTLNEM